MAQHDYNLANNTGQLFRSDLNDVLSAIVSLNSGSTAPTTTFAFQLWADTANDLLKIRNAANSAWITIGTLSAVNLGLLSLAGGTLTGALLAAAPGTPNVATPEIAFSGDPNTGIQRVSADILRIIAGGVEYVRVDGATTGAKVVSFPDTGALQIPVGTTAQRPASPANGFIRFNTDLGVFEIYSASAWRQVGSGGGGAGFKWNETQGNAPTQIEETGELVWLFENGLDQSLYASVKVPQSYTAGSQIRLYLSGYSTASSGTMLLSTVATLVRTGTDAFTSATNQRTSTNAALTNTSGYMLREFVCDLTDSTGRINAVPVSPGDTIKIRVFRNTGTDTTAIRFIPNATDIRYS